MRYYVAYRKHVLRGQPNGERRTRVNLHDICVSDSPVIRTVRGVRKVSYFFANAYRVPTGELTGPLAVHISGWSGFYGRGCTSAHPYAPPTIRDIPEATHTTTPWWSKVSAQSLPHGWSIFSGNHGSVFLPGSVATLPAENSFRLYYAFHVCL